MYSLRNSLHVTPRALRSQSPLNPYTAFVRNLRNKASDGDERPPEGHALDRKDQPKNTLDPEAQSVKDSTGAPKDERPAYVHGRVNKGGDVMGGAKHTGEEKEAASPSWWVSLKQKVGLGASSTETKHGSRSGNR